MTEPMDVVVGSAPAGCDSCDCETCETFDSQQVLLKHLLPEVQATLREARSLKEKIAGAYERAFEGCRGLVEIGAPVPAEKFNDAILAMLDEREEKEALKERWEKLKEWLDYRVETAPYADVPALGNVLAKMDELGASNS